MDITYDIVMPIDVVFVELQASGSQQNRWQKARSALLRQVDHSLRECSVRAPGNCTWSTRSAVCLVRVQTTGYGLQFSSFTP
ncbi:GD17688 [Drosophila simulans]|uniref:GD17688 n=1 Tax=Drosophila simulans TaxID=7240 RepID=B4NSR5_DROSI|nr:GD17688 [Drosophila simulans]